MADDPIDFNKLKAGDREEWRKASALVDTRVKRNKLAIGIEPEQLEDVLQDLLVRMFTNRGELRVAWGYASFISFIDRAVTNKMIDFHKLRRREKSRLVSIDNPRNSNDADEDERDMSNDIRDGSPKMDEIMGATQKLAILRGIMNDLSGTCPEVLWGMVRVEAGEISKDELLQQLGIPSRDAYNTRVSRCWKELLKHPKLKAVTESKE